MNKLILGILTTVISFQSIAAIQTTKKANITKLFAYDDYGSTQGKEGADIAVWFDTKKINGDSRS